MSDEASAQDHILSNKMYDRLKFLAQIVLPGLGTLYYTIAGLWHLPAATTVVGTVVAVDTFLGLVLGISSATYNNSEAKYDGVFNVVEKADGTKMIDSRLTKIEDPNTISDHKELLFKVEKQPPS